VGYDKGIDSRLDATVSPVAVGAGSFLGGGWVCGVCGAGGWMRWAARQSARLLQTKMLARRVRDTGKALVVYKLMAGGLMLFDGEALRDGCVVWMVMWWWW